MADENIKDLPSKYNPHGLEKKWYPIWEEGGYFSWKHNTEGEITKEQGKKLHGENRTFSMVIPPPNVTGSLHLGHALNHTIQDILVRHHRMKGDVSMWLPGTDHAGIATQNVVEKLLAKEGTNRWEMGREKFQERVWQWKEESGGMITHQQRELGESVDWEKERFTMDEGLSHTVREVFVSLYNEGLIYRSERIINWCPHCVTAISNIEVEHKERKGKLYHVHYPLVDSDEPTNDEIQKALAEGNVLTVATTRPETMLGDEALAVHPDDDRYKQFIGKRVVLPLIGKVLPVIADDFVDKEFGTGVVKITPAHDPNDFEAGKRHNLPITRVLDDHAVMNELAGKYKGLTREKAREKILEDLETEKYLLNIEDIKHAVGQCYRCSTVVEPISSLQWFVKVKPLAEKAIEVVKDGSIEFVPKRWENTYFEWMYNIQDWCISRQLWWGHRIPAYICDECGHIHVALSQPDKCEKCDSSNIKQDEDVLDTWFSSALWPFSTLLSEQESKESKENKSWPVDNTELSLFYPTRVLVTGFDIIFFWVARMIMMGKHFMKEIPFEKVYIHGLVRDADRAKMSKSKGNVVNPLEKMGEYGTDAFRFFMISILPEGKDIIYDESRLKGYAAFCNKIWNTARFIWMNQPSDYVLPKAAPGELGTIDTWILKEFNNTLSKINDSLEAMRFAEYAQSIYDFIWKTFCGHYLELSKTSLKDSETAETTRYVLNFVFLNSLKLLHPVMPFITEELYSFWAENTKDESSDKVAEKIIVASWPQPVEFSDSASIDGWEKTQRLIGVINKIRSLRGELGLPPGEKFSVSVGFNDEKIAGELELQKDHIVRLTNLKEFKTQTGNASLEGIKAPFDYGTIALDVLHLVDAEKEKERLGKEAANLEQYVNSINKKLSNEKFVENAPADLIEGEKSKQADAQRKLGEINNLLSFL
ncbi:MAG: valine--tRNA ligase [Leptospirales bacterium]